MKKIVNGVEMDLSVDDLQQISKLNEEYNIYLQTEKYKELRQSEYPPMSEYLDAIVKGDEQQKQDYINKCLAVKAKYPKPTSI